MSSFTKTVEADGRYWNRQRRLKRAQAKEGNAADQRTLVHHLADQVHLAVYNRRSQDEINRLLDDLRTATRKDN